MQPPAVMLMWVWKRRCISPSLPPEPRGEPQTVMYIYCGSLLSVHAVYTMSSIKSLQRVQKYVLDVFVISLVGSCHLLSSGSLSASNSTDLETDNPNLSAEVEPNLKLQTSLFLEKCMTPQIDWLDLASVDRDLLRSEGTKPSPVKMWSAVFTCEVRFEHVTGR